MQDHATPIGPRPRDKDAAAVAWGFTGDVICFEMLKEAAIPLWLRIAKGVLKHRHEAEQSVLLAIWKKMEPNQARQTALGTPLDFRKGAGTPFENFRAWSLRVVKNRALDCLKESRRGHDLAPNAAISGDRRRRVAILTGDEVPDTSGEVDEDRSEPDEAEHLLCCFLNLPLDSQLILILRFACGLSYRDIGQFLGIPTGTAHRQAKEAIRTLRKSMKQEYGHEC